MQIPISVLGSNNAPLEFASWEFNCKTGKNKVVPYVQIENNTTFEVRPEFAAAAQVAGVLAKLSIRLLGLSDATTKQIIDAIDTVVDIAVSTKVSISASLDYDVVLSSEDCPKNPGQFSELGYDLFILLRYSASGQVLGGNGKSDTVVKWLLSSGVQRCDCATGLPTDRNTTFGKVADGATLVTVPPKDVPTPAGPIESPQRPQLEPALFTGTGSPLDRQRSTGEDPATPQSFVVEGRPLRLR